MDVRSGRLSEDVSVSFIFPATRSTRETVWINRMYGYQR